MTSRPFVSSHSNQHGLCSAQRSLAPFEGEVSHLLSEGEPLASVPQEGETVLTPGCGSLQQEAGFSTVLWLDMELPFTLCAKGLMTPSGTEPSASQHQQPSSCVLLQCAKPRRQRWTSDCFAQGWKEWRTTVDLMLYYLHQINSISHCQNVCNSPSQDFSLKHLEKSL